MLSRRILFCALVAAVLLCATTAVDARRAKHMLREGTDVPATESTPHPEKTADAATLALWAQRAEELKARNYSRPSTEELRKLGFVSEGSEAQLQAGDLAASAYGVDVSAWTAVSTWQCIKNTGRSFAIVREFQQTCNPDPNGVHSVANAWSAGLAHVDIYLFPSYRCGQSASQQVDRTIDAMGSVPFGQLWFDVEQGGHLDPATNHAWLLQGIQRAVQRLGAKRVGIYANAYQWSVVMGGYGAPSQYPLWYAHYDNQANFNSFKPFAGWSRASMKQYVGDVGLCGQNVDLNCW